MQDSKQKVSHTPGPWNLGDIAKGQVSIDAKRPHQWTSLATVIWKMDREDASPVAEANAYLIAASPELKDALALCVHELEIIREMFPEGCKRQAALDAGLAALAKSERPVATPEDEEFDSWLFDYSLTDVDADTRKKLRNGFGELHQRAERNKPTA